MDFLYLDTISDGDKDFIVQFIETFESNTSDLVDSIKTAFQESKDDDMKKLAHKIKPSLLMLNLDCTQVVQDIMEDPKGISNEDIEELDRGCQEAIVALKKHYGL